MIRELKHVYIEGFGLFKGPQHINLDELPSDSVLGIFGFNSDGDGGYDSNAAGKTTFTNAISWCIFGMIPIQGESTRAITKEKVVNHDAKKAVVGLTYKIGLEDVYFESSISNKGTKKVYLEINGMEYEANTATQIREKFYSILGIGGKDKQNYIDFLNRCYFSGDVTKSFASKNFSDKDRLEIVAQVKKMKVLDIAYKLSDKKAATFKSEINDLEILLQEKNSRLDPNFKKSNYEQKITSLKKSLKTWEDKRTEITEDLKKLDEILKIRKEIDKAKAAIEPIKKEIDEQINLIKVYCGRINSASKTKSEIKIKLDLAKKEAGKDFEDNKIAIESKIKGTEDAIQSNELEINTSNNKIEELLNEIKGLEAGDTYNCPVCKSDLILDEGKLHQHDSVKVAKAISDRSKKIEEYQAFIRECQKHNVDHKKNLKDLKARRDEIKQIEFKIKSYSEQLETATSEREKLLIEVKDYVDLIGNTYDIKPEYIDYDNYEDYTVAKSKLVMIEEELSNIDEPKFTADDLNSCNRKINEFEADIKENKNQIKLQEDLKKEIEDIYQEQSSLKQSQSRYEYWKTKFKQLKNTELIETEPELENSVNRILSKLGTGIVTQFDVNVETGELSINLIEDSGNELPLELFSSGQANRISLAAGLALSELGSESDINYGFTMWDEVLDGLDNTGQDMFFDVLRDLPGLKFVISHDKKLQGFFDKKLLVTRKNHSSTIKLKA